MNMSTNFSAYNPVPSRVFLALQSLMGLVAVRNVSSPIACHCLTLLIVFRISFVKVVNEDGEDM